MVGTGANGLLKLRFQFLGKLPVEPWLRRGPPLAGCLNYFPAYPSYERKAATMAHNNERVELAIQILECRRKLRQAGWDGATIEEIRAEMKRLEQKLREIDE